MYNIIANTIKDSLSLDYLERVGGLVQKAQRPEFDATGKEISRFTFPIECGKPIGECWRPGAKYSDLCPNDKYTGMAYFEAIPPLLFRGYKDGKRRIMQFGGTLRLVVWLNFKKMGVVDCGVTDRVALEVFGQLTSNLGGEDGFFEVTDENFTNAQVLLSVRQYLLRDMRIFEQYSYSQFLENLFYPFDFFAFDLDVVLEVGRDCFTLVSVSDPLCVAEV